MNALLYIFIFSIHKQPSSDMIYTFFLTVTLALSTPLGTMLIKAWILVLASI